MNTQKENPILEIRNLTKYYKNTLGVKNLYLTLKEGEIFGFIGPNGAGKSTTIRSIMNLINQTDGDVLFRGELLEKDRIDLKKKIGYLPSEIALYEDLTVKEMIDYHELFYSKKRQERRKSLVQRFQLDEKKRIEDLSLGNLKKLGIILAFLHEPELVILDEPTSGLDPIMQQVFYDLLEEEKKKGTTIFYSTHILSEISRVCDRVGIIKDGILLKIESIKDLRKKDLSFVTITSKEVDEIQKALQVEVLSRREQTIRFKNTVDEDTLIKTLSKFHIEKLLIEEATLEEVFLHYYE